MLGEDLDDTHLCIKCSRTIVGLDNYIQHRKTNCSSKPTTEIPQIPREPEHTEHQYRSFDFPGTPNYHKTEETDKSSKSLTDSYDIPYDLGADVFFSSLELQSSSRKPISNSAAASTSGKHASSSKVLTRKASAALLSHHEPNDAWISPSNNTDNLMKAVSDISGTKKCDSMFIVPFHHDSPERSDDDEYDDEDYGTSPPSSHTGGKWKPGNTISPTILRASPGWDDRSQWDGNEHDFEKPNRFFKIINNKSQEHDEFDHEFIPPPGHTKGKWVPGTKIVKLDYKEEVEVEKIFSDQYWCNTCNRKLATKLLYERHIKSSLHIKRSEPEQELEQARPIFPKISERIKKPSIYLNDDMYLTENPIPEEAKQPEEGTKVRKRRKYFTKCDICKLRLRKTLLGKHLISHYHYRRMSRNPAKSFDMVLKNIVQIAHQAPYQCQPCKFYTNTQEDFMNHWNSGDHADIVEGPGRFCCNFCKFECEDNNQMRRHLLSQDHNEVILAINGSVPIIIGKRIAIECPKCKLEFRYNIELRKHAEQCTRVPAGTASNDYQSKFACEICKLSYTSQISLQKHKRQRHKTCSYVCSICKIEFASALEAKRHRSSALHRVTSASLKKSKDLTKKCTNCGEVLRNIIELKEHIESKHPDAMYVCPHCGEKFALAQEVSRHNRDKLCQASSSKNSSSIMEESLKNIERKPTSEDLTQTENEKLWKCTQCRYRSPMKAEFLYHEILHEYKDANVNTPIPCSVCQRKFRKYSLRYHLRNHTNERLYECSQCSMKFSRKNNFDTHMERIHMEIKKGTKPGPSGDEKPFQCFRCSKRFSKKSRLEHHIASHAKRDEKFKCSVEGCIYVARDAAILKSHVLTHTTEKIYQCSFKGCNYKGKTEIYLKRHIKVHGPPNKKFDCPHCDYKANTATHLKHHLRVHTGEKPYKCPYCSYHTKTLGNLRKHVIITSIHKGRYLYECEYCDPSDCYKTHFHKEYRTHLIVVHHIGTEPLES